MHMLCGTVIALLWVTIWYQNQMSVHTWFTCVCLQYRMYILSELVESYYVYEMLVWIWIPTKCPDSTSCFPQSLHHVLTHIEVYYRLTFLTGAWVKGVHVYSLGEGRACLQLG